MISKAHFSTYPRSKELLRGSERKPLNIKESDTIHGYNVSRKIYIPERNFHVYELIHEQTGAKHIHIECDDTDNTFFIFFKTTPMDNKGIAHILEHLALCGSEKYPVRDPFFNMIKRSLNTYMNAWTGPDFTGYPFSTQNVADYYNLLSIYLDAVFNSKLEYLDFLQEGHRLDFDEETGELIHSGVVYNEMKGALSDPNDLYMREVNRHLFTNTTYHYNSGGDPDAIREISHEDVKAFKNRFYHPSNSYTITYGDMPLEPHLKSIHEYFSQYDKIDPKSDIPDDVRFSEPKRVVFNGPMSSLSDPAKQVKVSVNWLVDGSNDVYERFTMTFLAKLLCSGPNSPMHQALIASNIGSSYSPNTGYSNSSKEAVFAFGLSDISEDDIDRVEKLILETLEKSSEEGFPKDRIESILHQLEFGIKNVVTGFGIHVISSIYGNLMHGGDTFETFQSTALIERLREDMNKGPLFQNLIKKWLIKNSHRVTAIMIPKENYSAIENAKEQESLDVITSRSDFEKLKETIFKESEALENRQNQEDDVSILPKIKLDEIERRIEHVATKKTSISEIPLFLNSQPTNGIVYFRSILDIDDLPQELLPYVPLFCMCLTRIGTSSQDYKKLAQTIEMNTGSFYASNSITDNIHDIGKYNLSIQLGSSCLERNTDSMFALWIEIVNQIRFTDMNRLKTLISSLSSSLHDSVIESGHSFATIMAAEAIAPKYRVHSMWKGISQLKFIRKTSEKGDLEEIALKLKEIAEFALMKNRIRVALNSEGKFLDESVKKLEKFIENYPRSTRMNQGSEKIEILYPEIQNPQSYLGLQTQVNFVAQSYQSVPYDHIDYSALDILTQVMSLNYLHKEIREKGGAYGGGVNNSGGVLSFYSYRDPNIEETLEAYRKSIDWVLSNNFPDEFIEEAKIQLISSLDQPTSPGKKGLEEFFNPGLTYDTRQRRRDRVFSTNREDLIRVCDKYFKSSSRSSVAVIGSDTNEEYKANKDWIFHEE